MNDMNDREQAFEKKYALDQEVMFKIEARACKLFGLWVASEIGLAGDAAKNLAAAAVSANLDEPGFEDVKRALRPIIADNGKEISNHIMDAKLAHFMEEAKTQILSEQK